MSAKEDLRIEAKAAALDAVRRAKTVSRRKGTKLIMQTLDEWIGATDRLFSALGRDVPIRPIEVLEGVGEALQEIDPEELELTHVLALLMMTFNKQESIPRWNEFYQRCSDYVNRIEPDRADKLLAGLGPR